MKKSAQQRNPTAAPAAAQEASQEAHHPWADEGSWMPEGEEDPARPLAAARIDRDIFDRASRRPRAT